MSRESYQEYMNSDHWKQLRAKKRRGRINRCAICSSTENIETHHLFYRNLYDVETSDLRLLCARCHETAHELIRDGTLVLSKHPCQNGRYSATKAAVKKRLGLTGQNMFYPKLAKDEG